MLQQNKKWNVAQMYSYTYILYTSRVTDTYTEAVVLYICPRSSGSLYAQSDCKLQGEF